MVAVFLGVSTFQARNMLDTDRQPAPALAAMTLVGDEFVLAETESQTTLVYFFAPWCHYCALSSGNLNRLHRFRADKGLRVITVALDWESVSDVKDYVEKHELNVPVLLGDAAIARAWKVSAFPTYYVLDKDHRIAARDIGYSTQLGLLWRSR